MIRKIFIKAQKLKPFFLINTYAFIDIIMNKNFEEKPYLHCCSICNTEMENKNSLVNHMYSHDNCSVTKTILYTKINHEERKVTYFQVY